MNKIFSLLFACSVSLFSLPWPVSLSAAETVETAVPTFVGSDACTVCHQTEAARWRGSQHAHAMAHATDKSVLGDFNDTTFDYFGVHSRFFRKEGKFFVETDGPDGKTAIFEIKYTFGVEPLQQYLIEFPDGRIQALSIAWDSRPKLDGGQRWFHLYPDENIRFDDILHWTKLNQNWNFMCAECHSTGVRKNYDPSKDHYATTWSEISVGCEACHGQGSGHVAWARSQQSWWPFNRKDERNKGLLTTFNERRGIVWSIDPQNGKVQRNLPTNILRTEIETCGRCHSRRGEISENWVPGKWLQDTHNIVGPLGSDVYWPDGQIRDVVEPYNYVPFKQSKMFASGVTCSDCHDPHNGKLKVAGENVCLQCHPSESYSATSHSHHKQTANSPACVSCHMPARTYMVIDPRHDHSIRVPRPDISVKLGTPNACIYCHTEKSNQWAAEAIDGWFGPNRKGFQTYAGAFHAASADRIGAEKLLASVAADESAPNVARANALSELAPSISPANADLARRGLSDVDPAMRIGAIEMLANVPPAQLWPLVAPLLSDSVRAVRLRAVNLLAAVPTERQPEGDRQRFESAAAEYVDSLQFNADRPEDRSALASFYARRGRVAEAEAEFKAALRLSPYYAVAAINLADLYRQLGREGDGESTLRSALDVSPQDAGLHYALGLLLNRVKRPDDSLGELRRAAELQPAQPRYAYVFAVGLHSAGRAQDAIAVLKENVKRHPTHRDSFVALVAFHRDAGDLAAALSYAEQLKSLVPDDQTVAALVETLRTQVEKTRQ